VQVQVSDELQAMSWERRCAGLWLSPGAPGSWVEAHTTERPTHAAPAQVGGLLAEVVLEPAAACTAPLAECGRACVWRWRAHGGCSSPSRGHVASGLLQRDLTRAALWRRLLLAAAAARAALRRQLEPPCFSPAEELGKQHAQWSAVSQLLKRVLD